MITIALSAWGDARTRQCNRTGARGSGREVAAGPAGRRADKVHAGTRAARLGRAQFPADSVRQASIPIVPMIARRLTNLFGHRRVGS